VKEEFARRHDMVLDLFRLLTEEAKKQKEDFVFIGGSAVQCVLKKPRRLSIDLDVWYSGNVDQLMASLGSDYSVEVRPSKAEMFRFFRVVRNHDGLLVKVDFLRHSLLVQESPYIKHKVDAPAGSFTGYVASPDYLLASKLVALGVNTLGRVRKQNFESDFIKDVVDCNSLLTEHGLSGKTWPYFFGVCQVQNKFLDKTHSVVDVASDAVKVLIECSDVSGAESLIQSQDLGRGNFGEYLLSGSLTKNEFSLLACRVAACLSFMQHFEGAAAVEAFSRLEKTVKARFQDRAFLRKASSELSEKGLKTEYLNGLRTLAPKALIYLHAAILPAGYG